MSNVIRNIQSQCTVTNSAEYSHLLISQGSSNSYLSTTPSESNSVNDPESNTTSQKYGLHSLAHLPHKGK